MAGERSNAVPNVSGTNETGTGAWLTRLQAELDATVNGKNYISGPPVGNPKPAAEALGKGWKPGIGAEGKPSTKKSK
jgi:hypothetical protein